MVPVLNFTQAHTYLRHAAPEVWDFLHLAGTPHDEPCSQAGENLNDSKIECQVLIEQLIRECGTPPLGTKFFIIRNVHDDAGIYYEAGIFYRTEDDEEQKADQETDYSGAEEYALECEASIPDKWDEEALASLRVYGHSKHQPGKVVQMKKAS